MRPPLGSRLFTTAVLSDSHVNEAEDRSASPYASNRLANARLRWAVGSINRHRPAFTVHLGDMGNPLPELSTYADAAAEFHRIAAGLEAPLHLLPGNHCVGDKPNGWVPVPRVCEASLARYAELYGPDRHSFDHGGCHFAALDSLLIDSGLAREAEQRDWLEEDLRSASAEGRRLFVLMHYPAFVVAADEPASYDNLDPPGRAWLLDLFARHGVEAALSGHVHNWFYNRHRGTALYTVPATSFVRQDYAELFPVEPADGEGGRDDRAKLGYCLLDVHERGHRVRLVRTGGATLAAGEEPPADGPAPWVPRPDAWPVGIEMRDQWLSRTVLRQNNSVSPFARRWARNDWALVALEEAGIGRVRLALEELRDAGVPRRLEAMGRLGFEFLVYTFGAPSREELALLREHRDLLSGWELIADARELETAAPAIRSVAAGGAAMPPLPCYWSEARGVEREQIDDANVKHVANYGFQVDDLARIERLWRDGPAAGLAAGPVIRARRRGEPEVPPWEAIARVDELGARLGLRSQVHLLFSGNVTAERFDDDLATACGVAEAALAAAVSRHTDLCLDTFEDVDRGYFVRHGLVDRRYNPRLAARVLGRLGAAIAPLGLGPGWRFQTRELDGCRQIVGDSGDSRLALVLPERGCGWRLPDGWAAPGSTLTAIDLDRGTARTVEPATGGWPLDAPLLLLAEPAAT